MVKAAKNILITGDVLIDHHIYEGMRKTSDSESLIGTSMHRTLTGSELLYKLLIEYRKIIAKTSTENNLNVEYGLKKSIYNKLGKHLQRYGIWKPSENNDRVWRMVEPLGYGKSTKSTEVYTPTMCVDPNSIPQILIINDNGLGFRHYSASGAWPKAIQDEKELEWIILKMSRPVAQGDLWRRLISNFQDRLVVVVSINDIRREEVYITKGISWEKTALELVNELLHNPCIQPLLSCKHLIIKMGMEGAIWVENAHSQPRFTLFYDPAHIEDEWKEQWTGNAIGYLTCFATGVILPFIERLDPPQIESGIQSGLSAMRLMHTEGHGAVSHKQPHFPYGKVANDLIAPTYHFHNIEIPSSSTEDIATSRWTILSGYNNEAVNQRPLYGIARRTALLGPKALSHIPVARFGKLLTVDRSEIESLQNIRKLMINYINHGDSKRPLSVAVFGPPGSGKSFGIIQIAKGILDDDVPILNFNLSQFSNPLELVGALHQVRDKVLEGKTPVIFWDEFDSNDYMWLQYFLAPMQDGRFMEGQIFHPIGKCVFVFAGGTSFDMENFGPSRKDKEGIRQFKLKKGPDFVSRLNGYLNVLGPNRRQTYNTDKDVWQNDPDDICFPIRRAFLIRTNLGLHKDERLDIDKGILSALLEIDRYHHGSRSMSRILSQLHHSGVPSIRRSDLPSEEVFSVHADYFKFLKIINRDIKFQTKADELAPHIHEVFRDLGTTEGWLDEKMDISYQSLPDEYKEDNLNAAMRIPQVLGMVGLYIVPDDYSKSEENIDQIIEDNIELLAEAEHNGWMHHKLKNGWRLGKIRDDDNLIHPCLLPYDQLSEQDKDKDRNAVRKYPDIIAKAKFQIVTVLHNE